MIFDFHGFLKKQTMAVSDREDLLIALETAIGNKVGVSIHRKLLFDGIYCIVAVVILVRDVFRICYFGLICSDVAHCNNLPINDFDTIKALYFICIYLFFHISAAHRYVSTDAHSV